MFAHADELETLTGCDGPYNPSQVLTYYLTTGGNFTGLEQDDYGPGTFACEDEEPFNVGVRPRAGAEGWRVDFNWAIAGHDWRTLKKIAFHTGAGGSPTA